MALLNAAKRLEPLNVALARETYLHAWVASTYAGPLAQPGGHLVDSLSGRAINRRTGPGEALRPLARRSDRVGPRPSESVPRRTFDARWMRLPIAR